MPPRAPALILSLALLVAGCGGDGEAGGTTAGERPERESAGQAPTSPAPGTQRVRRARCPDGVAGCVSATGTILYVERVDPDGDGDAHFVLLDDAGVTAPGITVVDVAADLRPSPLPGPGQMLSAAGPVFPGSYGQRQIEADVVSVAAKG